MFLFTQKGKCLNNFEGYEEQISNIKCIKEKFRTGARWIFIETGSIVSLNVNI